MCKQIIFTNINSKKLVENGLTNQMLVETCQELLSDQSDGFGYILTTAKSGIVGQRTNDIDSFDFKDTGIIKAKKASPQFPWSMISNVSNENTLCSNVIGNLQVDRAKVRLSGPALFHGRISTNNKALINVHPLSYDNSKEYLIHNGVVTNVGTSYPQVTSNDTEHLLHYMNGGIEQLAANITGYYAFAMTRADGALVIAKDRIAPLYSAWILELDTYVFASTESLIQDACSGLGLKVSPQIEAMSSDCYLEFKGNELIQMKEFKSLGFTMRESALSEKSLGYSLEGLNSSMSAAEEELVEYYDMNVDYSSFIERDKTQLTYQEYKTLSPEQKLDCDIYTIDGQSLLEEFIEFTRKGVA